MNRKPIALAVFIGMAGIPILGARNWSVQSALARALASNSELLFAREQLRLQERIQSLAILGVVPKLSFTYTDTGRVTYGGPDTYRSTLEFQFSQLIYNRGAYWTVKRQTDARRILAAENMLIQESRAAAAFLDLVISSLLNRRRITIRAELIGSARSQLVIAAEEFDLGSITELDLLEVEIKVLEQELALEELKRTQAQLEFQINAALDLDPASEVRFDAELNADFTGLLEELDASLLIPRALSNNPQMRQARFEVSAAADAVRAARRIWLPQVTARASVQFSGTTFPLSDPKIGLGLDLAWNLPLIPMKVSGDISRADRLSRSRSAKITGQIPGSPEALTAGEQARLSALQAGTKLTDQSSALTFSIEQAVNEISSRRRSLAVGRSRLALERRRVEITMVSLELGQLTPLDAVKSQVRLANLEIDLIESVVQLFRSELEVLRTIGTSDPAAGYAAIIIGFHS